MLNKQQLILIIGLASALLTQPAWAETRETRKIVRTEEAKGAEKAGEVGANGRLPLQKGTAADLVAQGVTRVTGVEVIQTEEGLELILETPTGQQLVPLILPEGNSLVIDILDATLDLPIGDRFRRSNPVPGIREITVATVDESSIRVIITGEQQTPSAEVVSGRDDLVLSVTPGDITAEQEPEEEREIVVTATRTEEEEENIPRAVTVITREEIEQQTAITRDLVDILGKTSPGLGPPTQTDSNFGQSIRGRAPQVLIDGVPITSNDSNDSFNRDLRSIAPEAVERIEIVRGPSAVFGNGATGGVINIITRRPSEQRLTSQTEVGVNAALGKLEGDSFGNFFSHSISGTEGNFDYLALFSRNDTGIFFDAEGDPIPFQDEGTSETETIDALGKVGVNFGDNQRLQLTANYTRDNYDFSLITDPSIDDLPFRTKARAIDVGEQEYIGASDPSTINTAINLDYSHKDLFGSQLNAQAYYRSTDVFPSAFDGRAFDFGVSRIDFLNKIFIKLGPGELQIGIENLLDNQYATVVQQWEGGFTNSRNLPARGRNISLNYRITW